MQSEIVNTYNKKFRNLTLKIDKYFIMDPGDIVLDKNWNKEFEKIRSIANGDYKYIQKVGMLER